MPVLTFNFEPDFTINTSTHELEVSYRPYIFVKLTYKNNCSKYPIRALVDSGADYNTFPVSFAEELGIDYTKGQKRISTGVGGHSLVTYLHLVKLKINSKEFDTVINFGEEVTVPLLGRTGFFNYFERVTFNVKKQIIELSY